MTRLAAVLPALVLLAATASSATAQSVYAGLGTTGATIGYAHSYGPSLGARIEGSYVPSMSRTYTEDGIDYSGDLRSRRVAALVDWRPFGGGFRLSAGLSGGSTSGSFSGAPATGTSITIGDATVPVGPADRYDMKAEFPSAMPYLGIGWGHSPARGWGLHADVGLLIGTPRISGSLSPSLQAKIAAAGLDPQAELDRELATVRDAADAVIGIPVLSLGVSYRW